MVAVVEWGMVKLRVVRLTLAALTTLESGAGVMLSCWAGS